MEVRIPRKGMREAYDFSRKYKSSGRWEGLYAPTHSPAGKSGHKALRSQPARPSMTVFRLSPLAAPGINEGMRRFASPLRLFLLAAWSAATFARGGEPFHDAVRAGGPQRIPGAVFCAYYDLGGEGVAFHDLDGENQGSGKLNPADGTYLNEFRRHEGLDTSYTKQVPDRESPSNRVTPPLGLLYVGWNDPGEWFNLTVETAAAGDYVADLLYTAQRDASISVAVNGAPGSVIPLPSTFDPAETIPWRQWHHWNVARDAAALALPAGTSVLTIRIVSGGNCNLATLLFRPAGTVRGGPAITSFLTPVR